MVPEYMKNNVLKKPDPVNMCLNYLLIHPKYTVRQNNRHRLDVYKTHIKKLCSYIGTAASYIFVLSIIPPY